MLWRVADGRYQLVIPATPPELRNLAMQECHDAAMAGHFGKHKTLATFPIRPCPKPPSKNLAVGGSGGGGPAYGGPARGGRTGRRREVGRGITEQNKTHVKNKD